MHKIVNKKAPKKLIAKFPIKKSKHALKVCPGRVPRTDLYKTSLKYSGAFAWNALPDNLRTTVHYSTFKNNLKLAMSNNY